MNKKRIRRREAANLGQGHAIPLRLSFAARIGKKFLYLQKLKANLDLNLYRIGYVMNLLFAAPISLSPIFGCFSRLAVRRADAAPERHAETRLDKRSLAESSLFGCIRCASLCRAQRRRPPRTQNRALGRLERKVSINCCLNRECGNHLLFALCLLRDAAH